MLHLKLNIYHADHVRPEGLIRSFSKDSEGRDGGFRLWGVPVCENNQDLSILVSFHRVVSILTGASFYIERPSDL
jgi:hypothetical protein